MFLSRGFLGPSNMNGCHFTISHVLPLPSRARQRGMLLTSFAKNLQVPAGIWMKPEGTCVEPRTCLWARLSLVSCSYNTLSTFCSSHFAPGCVLSLSIQMFVHPTHSFPTPHAERIFPSTWPQQDPPTVAPFIGFGCPSSVTHSRSVLFFLFF